MGGLEMGSQKRITLHGWLGEHTWLSPVGPKLEAGAKIRETCSYGLSLNHLGMIGTEVVVWVPGLVTDNC